MDHTKNQLVNRTLLVEGLIGALALASSIYRSTQTGWRHILLVHALGVGIVLLALLLRRRFSGHLRALIAIGALFIVGAIGVFSIGLIGLGIPGLITACILTALFFNYRSAWGAITLGGLVIAVAALGVQTGWITYDTDFNTQAVSISSWIFALTGFILLAGIPTFAAGAINHALIKNNRAIEEHLSQLEQTNTRLEAEISEKARIQQALVKSRARYRSVVDTQSELVSRYLPDETITFVNDAACRFFGLNREEMTGRNIYFDLLEEDKITARAQNAAMTPKNPIAVGENQNRNAQGELRWIRWTNRAFFQNNGELVEIQAVGVDITERVQAEEARSSSLEKYHTLFESADDAILILKDTTIIDCNQKTYELFNRSREELIGWTPRDLSPSTQPDGRPSSEVVLEVISRAQAGEPQQFEWQHNKPDGTVFDTEVKLTRLDAGEPPTLLAIVRDITERVRAEEAYRVLVESSLQALTIIQNNHVVFANPATEIMSGYSISELLVMENPISALIHPEDLSHIMDRNVQRSKGEDVLPLANYCIIRKNGETRWVESYTTEIEYRGRPANQTVYIDITERKQVEEALQQSEAHKSLVLRSLPMAFYTAYPYGDYGGTWVSDQIDTISGYKPQEFTDDPGLWARKLHPEDSEHALSEFKSLVEKESILIEYRWQTASGNYIWMQDHAVLIRDTRGAPYQAIGTWMDISERKKAEEELKRHTGQLEVLNEIEKGILAARSPEDIAQSAVDGLLQVVPSQRISVTLYDFSQDQFSILAVSSIIPTQLSTGTTGSLKTLENMIESFQIGLPSAQIKANPNLEHDRLITKEGYTGNAASFPLFHQDKLIGSLNIITTDYQSLVSDFGSLLQQVSAELAIAIQQARLHDQVQRHADELEQRIHDRTQELSILFDLSAAASHARDEQAFIEHALGLALNALKIDRGILQMPDESGQFLDIIIEYNMPAALLASIDHVPVDQGLGGWVYSNCEMLVLDDLDSDQRYAEIIGEDIAARQAVMALGDRGYVGVPVMTAQETCIGVLGLPVPSSEVLTSENLALLNTITEQLSIGLEAIRLRQATRQMAVSEERQRVARDLHDSINQQLYSLALLAQAAQSHIEEEQWIQLHQLLDDISTTARQALQEMRLMIFELRPGILAQTGLAEAIRHRLEVVEQRAGILVELDAPQELEIPADIQQTAYHIVQEALNNALKHARAGSIFVHIRQEEDRLLLEIQDDGCGFDLQNIQTGIGLSNMRERAGEWQGSFEIHTAPGEGTHILAGIPMTEPS